jgi:hypothetical protein
MCKNTLVKSRVFCIFQWYIEHEFFIFNVIRIIFAFKQYLQSDNHENWYPSLVFPPLAEQHRIVAKVDALMALCDALESRLKERAGVQARLAGAVVKQVAG